MTFIRLRKFLLYFYFVYVYYEKVRFRQIFLYIEMVWLLFFILSICCITLLDLGVLKQSWIPELNLTWSLYIILFHCCWIWFTPAFDFFFFYIHSKGIVFCTCDVFECSKRLLWTKCCPQNSYVETLPPFVMVKDLKPLGENED